MSQMSVSFRQAQKPSLPIHKVEELPQHYVVTYKTEASTGKKCGVGIASAIIPGLGQFINGDWAKGFAFLVGNIATHFIYKVNPIIGFISSAGVSAWSAIDAVKNSGKKISKIVPKEDKNIDFKA